MDGLEIDVSQPRVRVGPWQTCKRSAGEGRTPVVVASPHGAGAADSDAERRHGAGRASDLSLAKTRPADKWLIFQLGSADNLVS